MAAKDMTSIQIKLTNSQKILKYLQENKGEISNEEISRETGINKTNIPREIKKLENEGHKISKRYEQIGRSKFVWFLLTSSQTKQTSSQKKKNKLPVQKIKKAEKSESKNSIKENRGHREVISVEQMGQEVTLFGRTIPLDKVREIARETLLGHRVMMEGVKSWLGVWKKRYHEYKESKPEHFLIDKYEKAQETLNFLYKVEKLFKEITNGKS